MHFKLNTWLDCFILFIIAIKLLFVFFSLGHFAVSHSTNSSADLDPKMVYWKERTEFIFIFCMSILLIYHFHPAYPRKPISNETGLLFFLFGIIMILTAKWGLFVTEANWYKRFSDALH